MTADNEVCGPGRPRYRVLGLVTVCGEDGPLPRLAPKPLAVLAALLLRPNRVVAYERLIGLVWGTRPPPSVQGRLYGYVSELRARLGQDVIVRAGGGYLVNVGPGELDLQVFTDEVTEAQAELRAGHAAEAARRLRSALALWHGPALGGVTAPLIDSERPGLEERRLTAFEELFEAELAAGRPIQVVDELRQLASEHPFRERLAAQLMLALHRGDRRTEALGVYAEIRRRLVDELGIEPSQRLRDMQVQILNGSTDEARVAEPDAREQVRPATLPRDVDGFVGRADAMATLTARLTTDGGGICVISGLAGVGKTALAVHWAHTAREHFPDGQLYLNLRGYDPDHDPLAPATALGQLLTALQVPPAHIPRTVDERAALYRSMLADRKILVLLDNARDPGHVLPLLPPSGSVIVTGRHQLTELITQTGAQALRLPPLTDSESRALLAAALGSDRVVAESVSATELVRLCAGLALALRIASANIAASPRASISGMVGELTSSDRLAALALDGAEQNVVASAFAASYDALKPTEQRLFRLLALIPGPDFTAPEAAALAAVPLDEAVRHLRALVAACVVEHHTDGRYRFHDLIRLYAAQRARTNPDHEAAWARLVEYHLCGTTVATVRDQPGIMPLLRSRLTVPDCAHAEHQAPDAVGTEELVNTAAVALGAATAGPHPAAWLLIDHLRIRYHRTGQRPEWLEIAPALLDAAREHRELDTQALLHRSIGTSSFRTGRQEPAVDHLHEAIRMARDCRWTECEAVSLADLGVVLAWTGRLAEAREHTERALALFSELGSASGECRALRNLGGQYFFLGDLRCAEEYYRRALAVSERHGLELARAADLMHLGSVRMWRGHLAEAEDLFMRALELFGRFESLGGLAAVHPRLALLFRETGDHPRAQREATTALRLSRESGDKILEASAFTLLGDAEMNLGEYATAHGHLQAAMDIVRGGDFYWHQAETLSVLARLKIRTGDRPGALDCAERASSAARRGGYVQARAAALVTLTEAYLHAGERELTLATGREALALIRRCDLGNDERRLQRLLTEAGLSTP
ncbi:AfsR/SARP family transcriptional regulator [Pseudonocardia acaciae]|uniref:AfsR/SARP family transcriptional regulator n=1 Tax=Pseudonocardia acaciae TaxID=551276 RepID=UPI0006844DC3|nr:BTAD domain-containing putative transcriptional regulator [Pseudonocardia acaciae]